MSRKPRITSPVLILVFLVSLPGAALFGKNLIVPEASLGAVSAEDRWITLGIHTGMQDIIFLGQPESYQIEAFTRFGLGLYEIEVALGGLNTNIYGFIGLRRQWLFQDKSGVNLIVAFRGTVPGLNSAGMDIQGLVGADYRRTGWTAGLNAGFITSPSPNQGPTGVNMNLYALGAFYYQLLPFLSLNAEVSVSPYVTSLFPGIRLIFGPVSLAVVLPVNLIYYQSFTASLLYPAVSGEFQWHY